MPPRTVGDPSELCFNSFLHKIRAALASSTVEEEPSGRDSQDDRLRIDQDASGQTIQLLQEAEHVLKLGSLNGNTEHRKTGSCNFTFTTVGRAQEHKAGKNAAYSRGEMSSAHDVCVCVCQLTEAPVDLDSSWDSHAGLSASSAGLILL